MKCVEQSCLESRYKLHESTMIAHHSFENFKPLKRFGKSKNGISRKLR